ncbi:MAG: hypothetical protein PUK66_07090 [Bacteroidales bacterium]|uniref:hypothetical protein n=1 Tax=Porphyromonas sp. TaxID=1924944 RepID=UPI002977D9D0|nr:hypothetical protein [Porphyromonas sp.]MDD7438576.1 hypothetical protein [Bacteroidales bacterium]MDY3067833.1 hypothetical protein [Porphyromonas sp.]
MDEVSIDIRLNSNVEEEAGKASSSIERMAQEAISAKEETQRSIDLQTQYLAKLRTEYAEVQKALAKMQYPTREKQELQRTSAALLRELNEEESALQQLQKELSKMDKSYGLISAEIRKTKAEMATLSAAGKQGSDTYRRLEQDLRELSEAQTLVNRTSQELGKGDRSWKGLADAVSAFSGAASAAMGAWALLGGSQEDQAAMQTKLQSLMAITIGLQQVQNIMLETSTFRIQTVTKAKRLWAAANTRLATSLGISTVAAKALMGTLTLGLSVAIGVLISAFDKWQSKQKAIREEQQRFTSSVSSNVASLLAKFEEMRRSYAALGDDLKAKNKYVQENKKNFEELGVAINGANDADNLFIRNADAFKSAMMERAKAVASMEIATEIYKEAIQKMMAAEKRAENPTFWDRHTARMAGSDAAKYGYGSAVTGEELAKSAADKMQKEADEVFAKGDRIIEQYQSYMSSFYAKLDEANIDPHKEGSGGGNATDERAKMMEEAAKRLAQIAKSNEEELLAIELAALQEGRAKKLRELKIENEKRKALLEERRRDLEELAKAGIDTTAQQAKLKLVSDNGDAEYLRKVAEANAASDRIMQEVEATLDAKVATRQEQRINSARAEYQALRYEAEQHAKSKEELADILARIARSEQEELSRIHKEGELERIDFYEMVALRRIQLSTKHYDMEIEREEELLTTELSFAKQRQAKLQELQENGADVSKELEEVTEKIKDLSAAIEDIPARKFEELAQGAQKMLSTLSRLGGEIGETFGSLSESVGVLIEGTKKGANTIDQVSATLSGIMQVADVAIQQAKANKEFMEAWQLANESALQVARMQRIEGAGYKEGNIFGVENPFARAIAGAKQYAQAMWELQDLSRNLAKGHVQTGTQKALSGANIAKGVGGGAAAGGAIGSMILPGIGTAIGAGIGALIGGIFGGAQKKLVPIFENLGKKYGEIYNKDTFALNPDILRDYDKLDAATKKLVDNWEAIQKKAEEAQQQMRDNFRSLAGDIGNQLSEALKRGIADGDIYTAFDDFKAYASKVIYDIGEQMIFAQFFQQSFDELQRRMEESFGADGDGDIRDDIRWIVDSTKGNIDKYKEAMDAMREEMERQGLQLPDMDASRKAEARGIGRMTQDSAERLEGLMTVQVDRLSTLVTYAKQTDDYQRDARVYFATMMRQIDRIAANSDYLRKLESIASDMYRVAQEGIYIKR